MHLKYSKGSRHALHFQAALQAVEPNSLTTEVFNEAQRGQRMSGLPSKSRFEALPAGGAMPYARSFSFPSALIQSVVHGGDKTRRIVTSPRSSCSRHDLMLSSMTSVAGQPEYVGATSTITPDALTSTLRTMPRFTTLTTGISGSSTSASSCQTYCSPRVRSGCVATTPTPGNCVANIAFLRLAGRNVRCVARLGHRCPSTVPRATRASPPCTVRPAAPARVS